MLGKFDGAKSCQNYDTLHYLMQLERLLLVFLAVLVLFS
jgi:hypothetical protein